MNEQEQKLRKHTHEMESLTFRNDQLAKRISVLQQELQQNSSPNLKKGKTKTAENNVPSSLSILDEELHKKILENAQLVSTVGVLRKLLAVLGDNLNFRWQIKI